MHGGVDNIRYSPLAQINRDNVARLQVAWTYDSHDAFKGSEMQSNPVVVDGVLYVTTPTLKVVAVDAATGREIWKFDPSGGASTRRAVPPSRRHRPQRSRVRHLSQLPLGARHGRPGSRSRRSAPTAASICARASGCRPIAPASAPARRASIFEDLLIIGSSVPETLPGSPGHIRAFDVNTGKLRWIFHTIPQPGEFGYDTWPTDAYQLVGGANAWAGVTVDARNGDGLRRDRIGVVRLLRRQPARRQPVRRTASLALDARTGKRVWHFQGIKHDVWDWDFPGRAESRHRHAQRPPRRRGRAGHEVRLRLRARSADRRAAVSDREPQGAAVGRSTASSWPSAALPGEAAAVRAAGPHRGDADARARPRRTRRCSRSSGSSGPACSRRRPSAGRSSFPASTAAPNGAARRSIRRRRCSTSTRTRCRGSCG